MTKGNWLPSMCTATRGGRDHARTSLIQEAELTDGFALPSGREELVHNVLVSEDNV